MVRRRSVFLVAGIALGVTLATAARVLSFQQRLADFKDLTAQKADISRMDWLLLQAQVAAIESTLEFDANRTDVPRGFTYDTKRQVVQAVSNVNPVWLSTANVDQVKKTLAERAVEICADAQVTFLGEVDIALSMKWKDLCVVRFNSVSPEVQSAGVKDVAHYEHGKLALD